MQKTMKLSRNTKTNLSYAMSEKKIKFVFSRHRTGKKYTFHSNRLRFWKTLKIFHSLHYMIQNTYYVKKLHKLIKNLKRYRCHSIANVQKAELGKIALKF